MSALDVLRDRETALIQTIERDAAFLADLDDQMHRTAKDIDESRSCLADIRAAILKIN